MFKDKKWFIGNNDIFFSFLGKTFFHKYEYKLEDIKRKKNDMQMLGDVFS